MKCPFYIAEARSLSDVEPIGETGIAVVTVTYTRAICPMKIDRKLVDEYVAEQAIELEEEPGVFEFSITGHPILGDFDDNYASQLHARVYRQQDGFLLEDLGSTNGTYLNRATVTAPVLLRPGDQVQVGSTVFEVVT